MAAAEAVVERGSRRNVSRALGDVSFFLKNVFYYLFNGYLDYVHGNMVPTSLPTLHPTQQQKQQRRQEGLMRVFCFDELLVVYLLIELIYY